MRTVAILGLGASGVAAARLALSRRDDVHVSDIQTDAPTRARAADLRTLGADVELGSHDVARIAGADLVVVSPGIPPNAPVLRELRARGVRWISEPELAARVLDGALIAVTGTNGKTTTVLLVHHLLSQAGVDVAVGGNVGGGHAPAASELALTRPTADWYVLELSSYQLADIDTLTPDIGVLTNLAPDHLDRYESVEAYWADKARLFDNASDESIWVLNGDQPEVEALAGDAPGRRFRFNARRPDSAPDTGASSAWIEDGMLTLDVGDGVVELVHVRELPLLGRHNHVNALCAALVAHLAGVEADHIRDGLRTVSPLPHRLEAVGEFDGVLWVNDSKATNVASTVSAVESLERPLVVLLGGTDKGESMDPLATALAARGARIRAVVTYGAAGPRIARDLEASRSGLPLHRVEGGLADAVALARTLARPGDAILLAPAASSFDEFENYAERGETFARLARAEAA
ncbi:MAG TPA: UDP-N-acetylmuramoyl-L-alanine--D-glutamate ligase [Longimicrobiales bacterium]|nr:UDP-N-acetylmuramoyl-L-alanine--D-glutamate ligase [Longimicrobiales bacterium]